MEHSTNWSKAALRQKGYRVFCLPKEVSKVIQNLFGFQVPVEKLSEGSIWFISKIQMTGRQPSNDVTAKKKYVWIHPPEKMRRDGSEHSHHNKYV